MFLTTLQIRAVAGIELPSTRHFSWVFAPVPNLDNDNFIVRNGVAHPITGLTEWNEQIPQLRLVDVLNGDADEWKPQELKSGITNSLCGALRRIGVVNTDKITK